MHVYFLCVSHMLFVSIKKHVFHKRSACFLIRCVIWFLLSIWHICKHPSKYTNTWWQFGTRDHIEPCCGPPCDSIHCYSFSFSILRTFVPLFSGFVLFAWSTPSSPNVKPKLSTRISCGKWNWKYSSLGVACEKYSSIQPCICSSLGGDNVDPYTQLCAEAMFTNTPTNWV